MESNDVVKRFYETEYNEDEREKRQSLEFIRSKRIIARYLNAERMEIADLCGATGAYSFWLAERGHNVHLLDLVQKHIDIARQRGETVSVSLASYACADARALPYADASMDLVLLMGALYHLRTRDARLQCLEEAYRILKPGGVLLCTVINRHTLMIASIKYELQEQVGAERLRNVLESGQLYDTMLPMAYCHLPEEIRAELESAGFLQTQTIAVEGIANALGYNDLPEDTSLAAHILACIELTESLPELLGATRNLIAVGKKPV